MGDSYVRIGSLRPLKDVLHEWIKVITRCGGEWEWEEVPWWENEQATVSTLTAALWNAGGIALEKFSTNRGNDKKPIAGRCDLYIKIGRSEFIGEAKQCWSAARSKQAKSKLNIGLKEACDDVKKVESKGERKLGVVFAVPYVPLSKKSDLDTIIENWLKLVNKIECSSLAWIFPPQAKEIRFKESNKFYIYPGVALLIREVKKKTS